MTGRNVRIITVNLLVLGSNTLSFSLLRKMQESEPANYIL